MPNWCEGTLKIRGKTKDIKNFFLTGLEVINIFGANTEIKRLVPSKNNDEYFEIDSNDSCYIPHTRRGFVESPYVFLETNDEDMETVAVQARFAWGINATELLECCKEYHLDIRSNSNNLVINGFCA